MGGGLGKTFGGQNLMEEWGGLAGVRDMQESFLDRIKNCLGAPWSEVLGELIKHTFDARNMRA